MVVDHSDMAYPVCVGATVSRKTGEITFEWEDNYESCRRCGEIMMKLAELYERYQREPDEPV